MKDYFEKIKTVIPFTLIFYVMFGILAPLEIYAGNKVDFEFGFHDFFWMFLGIYGVIWLVGTAIIAVFSKKIIAIINTGLGIVGVLFYVQYAFLNKKLSMANGGNMDWASLKSYSTVNIAIWGAIALGLLLLAIFLKDKWQKASKYIVLFLTAIQLVAVISLIIQVPKTRVFEYECRIDATKQMAVAPNDNIIVVILDGYSNEKFDKNLRDNPEIAGVLKDFTYYNNANSVYESTSYCMNTLLTGQIPNDDDDQNPTWRQECWYPEKVQDFYDILHNKGYETILVSQDTTNVYGDLAALDGKFDNVGDLPITLHADLLFRLLTKMSIYKYVPYILKPKFEVMYVSFTDVIASVHYDESVHMNAQFYQKLLNDKMYVDTNMNNLFKVQHIQGMHPSFTMDENGMEVSYEVGTEEKMMKGLNLILEEYINQLKETGVYDNATVIFTADHGDSVGDFTLQPLVLIKRSGEKHDSMLTNSAPISHYDFVPTILSYLGEDYKEYASGTSIYDWNEKEERERTVTIVGITRTYYHDRNELDSMRDEFWNEVNEKRERLGIK